MRRRITCGVYIFNPDGELLVCHATETTWGIWGIPKGRPDPGEGHKTAAIREVKEETGLDLMPYEDSMVYAGAQDYRTSNKRLMAWVVQLPEPINIESFHCESLFTSLFSGEKIPEVDDFMWVRFEEFEDRLHSTAKALWKKYLNE